MPISASAQIVEGIPRYFFLRGSQYREPASLRPYVERNLEQTLAAAGRIPFYRERFGGAAPMSHFPRLPILKRTDVPALNQSVRSLYDPRIQFRQSRSSGSTGTPVEFLFDRAHQAMRHAARARYLLENGWTPL